MKPGAGNIPDSGDAVNLAWGFLGSKSKHFWRGWYWNYVAPIWRAAGFFARRFWLALAEFARKNRIVAEIG